MVGGDQRKLEAPLHPRHVSFDFCNQSCFSYDSEEEGDCEKQLRGGSALIDENMKEKYRTVFWSPRRSRGRLQFQLLGEMWG